MGFGWTYHQTKGGNLKNKPFNCSTKYYNNLHMDVYIHKIDFSLLYQSLIQPILHGVGLEWNCPFSHFIQKNTLIKFYFEIHS